VKNLRNRAQELKKEYEILLQEKQYIDQIETYEEIAKLKIY